MTGGTASVPARARARLARRARLAVPGSLTVVPAQGGANALVAARTMTGADYWTVSGLPHEQLQDVLRRHGMLVEKQAQ